MKKVVVILFALILLGVLTLEIVTFIKLIQVNDMLPNIENMRK